MPCEKHLYNTTVRICTTSMYGLYVIMRHQYNCIPCVQYMSMLDGTCSLFCFHTVICHVNSCNRNTQHKVNNWRFKYKLYPSSR